MVLRFNFCSAINRQISCYGQIRVYLDITKVNSSVTRKVMCKIRENTVSLEVRLCFNCYNQLATVSHKNSQKTLLIDCQSNISRVLSTHHGQQLSVFRWFCWF